MSLQIITAIRSLPQLKGSLKFTAIELAHLASRAGHARVSYWTLAKKTGLHLRTMIRHVHRLIALGILVKQTVRLTLTRFAVNAYTFLVGPDALHKRSTDNMRQQRVPEEGKLPRVRVEAHPKSRLPVFLSTLGLTEGSVIWQAVAQTSTAPQQVHEGG